MNFDAERFADLLKLEGPYNSNFEGMSNDELVDALFGTMDMTAWLRGNDASSDIFKAGLRSILLEAGSRYAIEQLLLSGMHHQTQAYQEKKAKEEQRGENSRVSETNRSIPGSH